jgi:hypothetical protein
MDHSGGSSVWGGRSKWRWPGYSDDDRICLAESKRLANQILHQDLERAMRTQEWLFRTYIASGDNHPRIDALQAKLAAAKKK